MDASLRRSALSLWMVAAPPVAGEWGQHKTSRIGSSRRADRQGEPCEIGTRCSRAQQYAEDKMGSWVTSLSGRTAFPKLLPEVFISDVHLPVDRIIGHRVQLLDIATLDKWGGRYALSQSQVMVIRARRHLTRRVDNYVKMGWVRKCC